jgi:16S rRNA (uracil1498-N3)-methyltransferase
LVNLKENAHTTPRLFIPTPLAAGAPVPAEAGQAHYLGNVLRRAPSDLVRLFNGRDGEFAARIDSMKKDRAVFVPEALLRPQAAEPDLWLVFALLKRDATDLVVQKATELGASAICPIFTARTNAGRVNLERLTAIAVEAAEQSERLTVPEVRAPVAFYDLLGNWPADRMLAAAVERMDAPSPGPPCRALLVGPEGGFNPRELDALRDKPFIRPVSLGRLVLRAETAAIAGLALLGAPGH